MDADATRALIDDLLDAYNEPDIDRAALLYAEDCRYLNRALVIRIEVRAAQRANMQAFLDRFPDRKLRPLRIIADDGGVAVEAEFVATSPG
ncbi:MAG TPA: nuclear transport factor 2 family protein, partial [Rubrobacter sp.]|nr:nuclear transport factor 2 family protein [Rubrobacter sp.]